MIRWGVFRATWVPFANSEFDSPGSPIVDKKRRTSGCPDSLHRAIPIKLQRPMDVEAPFDGLVLARCRERQACAPSVGHPKREQRDHFTITVEPRKPPVRLRRLYRVDGYPNMHARKHVVQPDLVERVRRPPETGERSAKPIWAHLAIDCCCVRPPASWPRRPPANCEGEAADSEGRCDQANENIDREEDKDHDEGKHGR